MVNKIYKDNIQIMQVQLYDLNLHKKAVYKLDQQLLTKIKEHSSKIVLFSLKVSSLFLFDRYHDAVSFLSNDQNLCLYEYIDQSRKQNLYFDIEWFQRKKKKLSIQNILGQLHTKIKNILGQDILVQQYVRDASGYTQKKNKAIKKFSYHIIFNIQTNNGFNIYIQNQEEQIFFAQQLKQKGIDMKVYKVQNLRLTNQDKWSVSKISQENRPFKHHNLTNLKEQHMFVCYCNNPNFYYLKDYMAKIQKKC